MKHEESELAPLKFTSHHGISCSPSVIRTVIAADYLS